MNSTVSGKKEKYRFWSRPRMRFPFLGPVCWHPWASTWVLGHTSPPLTCHPCTPQGPERWRRSNPKGWVLSGRPHGLSSQMKVTVPLSRSSMLTATMSADSSATAPPPRATNTCWEPASCDGSRERTDPAPSRRGSVGISCWRERKTTFWNEWWHVAKLQPSSQFALQSNGRVHPYLNVQINSVQMTKRLLQGASKGS